MNETLQCIIGRAVSIIHKADIQDEVGPIQLCASYECGCEATVHALHEVFSQEQCHAVIEVDATNAFNSLSH